MTTGCRVGEDVRAEWGIGLFVRNGGYTTVATAVALLVSVTLVFCVASVGWVLSRAADVQEVADVAALAGSNAVASYCTVAQVVDASVLSMGLAGMAVLGAGLVLAAVPGAQGASNQALHMGKNMLDARNTFARNAVRGLRVLEAALPWVVVANSWASVNANDGGNADYIGVALPVPLESQSDFSSLDEDVGTEGLDDAANRIQEAAQRAQDARERAEGALERAWTADCVDSPRCMMSRATDLAALADAQNPFVAPASAWTFGVAIQRSRAYYQQRLAREQPEATDIESVTDSVARKAFYAYALEELRGAWYQEHADGTVSMHVPHLACTVAEVRSTPLYTDVRWPCTQEAQGRTLHSTSACPGATGAAAGADSVAAVDSGTARLCEACAFDVHDLGAVASISTIANNGYEHYWQIVVEEAERYESARNEQAEADRKTKEAAEEGESIFERLLEQFKVPRAHVCPPGAWGCVGIVARRTGTMLPSELTGAFLRGTKLPAGVAVSASALAPDESAGAPDALSRLYASVVPAGALGEGPLLGSVVRLWGGLLMSYGTAYEGLGDAVGGFLDKADGVFGGSAGAWLKRKISQAMGTLGLEPADMRARRPVLVSAREVLAHAGIDVDGKVAQLVRMLPSCLSASDVARAADIWIGEEVRRDGFVVADLTIPGTDKSVPLSVDLLGSGL